MLETSAERLAPFVGSRDRDYEYVRPKNVDPSMSAITATTALTALIPAGPRRTATTPVTTAAIIVAKLTKRIAVSGDPSAVDSPAKSIRATARPGTTYRVTDPRRSDARTAWSPEVLIDSPLTAREKPRGQLPTSTTQSQRNTRCRTALHPTRAPTGDEPRRDAETSVAGTPQGSGHTRRCEVRRDVGARRAPRRLPPPAARRRCRSPT